MDKKGIWIAFAVGVAAGAAVALLYAPESGAEMRTRLRGNLNDGLDQLGEAATYLKEQADSLSRQAQSLIERTRGQMHGMVDTTTDIVSNATKSVQSLM
jgi:gas vesicle protein